jgi:hypothetical protein
MMEVNLGLDFWIGFITSGGFFALKIEEVKEIKNILYNNEISQKDIAKMFDVYPSTINWIKKGETWKNI